MPQELTPEQRLTQIEKILQSAIKLSHSTTAKIDNLTEKVEANSETIKANNETIDRISRKVEANSEAIKANSEAIAGLTTRADRLTEQIATATNIFIDSIGVMREMQNEIKGLQIENRRIMDHIFGKES